MFYKIHDILQNLIIDIGNTAVKAAWADGITLGKTFRYQGERSKNFILSLTSRERPCVMIISSAYEIPGDDIKDYEKVCNKLVLMDSSHNKVLEDNSIPTWLPCDRAASIIAARYLFKGKGSVVFDFGTTLTVDYLDKDGNYQGGNISLGCRTRFKALNRYSRALPLFETPDNVQDLGTSLETSAASGIILGIMFEIAGYVSRKPENIIIFTGGDAIYFAKRMKNSIFVVCNLVLIGLALIADGYVKKMD